MAVVKPKNTLQEQRKLYVSMFGESCPETLKCSLKEIEDAIDDCKAMLDEAIDRSDKNEISYWRKMLQENKVQRREILST